MSIEEQSHPSRTLVVHDSRYGSTAEVADQIGRTLAAAGRDVAVRHVEEVESVDGFDLVIIGSPIRFENWMPGAAGFVAAHREQLASTAVAFFFTCLALSQDGPKSQRDADRYEQKVRAIAPELVPLGVGRFAGKLDFSRMSLFGRVALGTLLAVRGARAGDHRDWPGIRSWAEEVAASARPVEARESS